MSAPDNDDDLNSFLERRTALPPSLAAVTKGAADIDGPPPEIDQKVFAIAREAVRDSTVTPIRRRPRWVVPAALAATLVLAFSIVMRMDLPIGDRVTTFDAAQSPAMQTESAPARVPSSENAGQGRDTATASTAADSASPAAAAMPAPEAQTDVAPPLRPETERSRTAATAKHVAPTYEAKAYAPPPPAPASAAASRDEREQQASSSGTDLQAAQQVAPAPSSVAANKRSVLKAELPRDPNTWYQAIRQLRREGKTTEADREWTAFHEAFPDYVPPNEGSSPER